MREIIRVVQQARKAAGLRVDDRIVLSLQTDDTGLQAAIEEHADTITSETLATNLGSVQASYEVSAKIEGVELRIGLGKTF